MWQYINTEEPYHYGIKGMKWGVRRHGRSTINGQLKRPRAMDEGGVYSTGKGRMPKYTLPKGRTTKLGTKLKNMNDVLMHTKIFMRFAMLSLWEQSGRLLESR